MPPCCLLPAACSLHVRIFRVDTGGLAAADERACVQCLAGGLQHVSDDWLWRNVVRHSFLGQSRVCFARLELQSDDF